MNPEHKKTILKKIPNGLFIATAKDGDLATGAVAFICYTSFN